MNAKKAKAARRAVREVAQQSGIPMETSYLVHKHTGVIRVGKCFRGLYRHLRRRIRRGETKFLPRNRAVAVGA